MKQIWQKQNKTQIAPNWVRDTEILIPNLIIGEVPKKGQASQAIGEPLEQNNWRNENKLLKK